MSVEPLSDEELDELRKYYQFQTSKTYKSPNRQVYINLGEVMRFLATIDALRSRAEAAEARLAEAEGHLRHRPLTTKGSYATEWDRTVATFLAASAPTPEEPPNG